MKILRNLLMMAVLATAASMSQAGTAQVESPAITCSYAECNWLLGTGCPGVFQVQLCTSCTLRIFSSSVCQYPTQ
jgi:hypothetical protein